MGRLPGLPRLFPEASSCSGPARKPGRCARFDDSTSDPRPQGGGAAGRPPPHRPYGCASVGRPSVRSPGSSSVRSHIRPVIRLPVRPGAPSVRRSDGGGVRRRLRTGPGSRRGGGRRFGQEAAGGSWRGQRLAPDAR
ncbi:hypothetical protein SSTG_04860 [Streptomyces sp. e14]|nr:hypothetical protein SSTG_04860 [Streptomyces sp. e14]